jgi:hypothetical protein
MSKTNNTPDANDADARFAALEQRFLEQERRHAEAVELIRNGQSTSIVQALDLLVQRVEITDPTKESIRRRERGLEVMAAQDRHEQKTLEDLLSGSTGYTAQVMEPVRAGRESAGFAAAPPKPYVGLGLVLFAESAMAAEMKFRAFFGIRELTEGLFLTVLPLEERRAERIRAHVLGLVAGCNFARARQVMGVIAGKAAIADLPKSATVQADELEALEL